MMDLCSCEESLELRRTLERLIIDCKEAKATWLANEGSPPSMRIEQTRLALSHAIDRAEDSIP